MINSIRNLGVFIFLIIALQSCSELGLDSLDRREMGTGKTYALTWSFDTTATIKLYRGDSLVKIIAERAKKPYSWQVPREWIVPNQDYTIRYYDNSDSTQKKYTKEEIFISQDLNITQPNGFEKVEYSGINIRWKWVKSDWKTPVKIELWKGNNFYSKITDYANNQEFTWKLIQIPDAADYRIKIISLSDPNEYDFSDNYFIFGYGDLVPIIEVKYPNGGEKLSTAANIRWEWKNKNWQSRVKIELWKGDKFHSLITDRGENQMYTWGYIKAPSGKDYKIKIIDIDNPEIFDFSDNYFEIIND